MPLMVIKTLVPLNGNFCNHSLSYYGKSEYTMKVREPGLYCFLGYQKVDTTEEESGPLMYFQNKSGEDKYNKSRSQLFFLFSVISSFAGLYALIYWLYNVGLLNFSALLGLIWYFTCLVNTV
ncbi:hypothetical protein SOMG_04242 [Schizosaccharomyces osmophilus]|uniref:Uncharacterized protein n=1 Tax=Schizosaccharomyces osmophilus TaxID=2545709 RepID=A0AAE9WHY3_9SCHI|nr:uncharacterized protein SOMG_04242 [Schizosaccharomyces osmophilus]WBW75222.1 hypothetical protein SOMG_04242 [Schizosaccharomyces osmophilus]